MKFVVFNHDIYMTGNTERNIMSVTLLGEDARTQNITLQE
jgi:hypothetical protein